MSAVPNQQQSQRHHHEQKQQQQPKQDDDKDEQILAADVANARNPAVDLPLPPPQQDTNYLFQLTDVERRRALELKGAVEARSDLENLPDLQYVQFAIANQHEDLDALLQRVHGLQTFRHEYGIVDSFEQGVEILEAFTKTYPFALLSVAYDDETQNYGLIYDRTKMAFKKAKSEGDWRILLGCPYYLFSSLVPDPHSMRQGIFLIGECEGMQNSQVSVDVFQRIYYHFTANVPIIYRSIKFFHTNVVANLSFSMMKPFLNRSIKEKVVLGCQFGANISDLYLLPTKEIAVARALRRMEDFLRQRYQNQKNFRL